MRGMDVLSAWDTYKKKKKKTAQAGAQKLGQKLM